MPASDFLELSTDVGAVTDDHGSDIGARVRTNHPLRAIRLIVNETLAAMERDFAPLYTGLSLYAIRSVRDERDT